MMFLLCTLIALVSANQLENERRRPVCGGLCIAIAGGVAGGVAGNATKKRRRIAGGFLDSVCSKTMGLVRTAGDGLKDLLDHEGADNMTPLRKTLDAVESGCERLAQGGVPMMNQCTFYVGAARKMDEEMLEGAWLNAWGNDNDQSHGCGKVVNKVNKWLSYVPWMRRAELENGQEVFITADESTNSFRRLIGAAATGVVGAGMYLAHVCNSFDEANNLIQSESTMEWN